MNELSANMSRSHPSVILGPSVQGTPFPVMETAAVPKAAFHRDLFPSGFSQSSGLDLSVASSSQKHDACDSTEAVSSKRVCPSSSPCKEAYQDASYYSFSMKYFVHMLSCYVEELQSLSFHSPSFQNDLRGIVEGEKCIIRHMEKLFLSPPERADAGDSH